MKYHELCQEYYSYEDFNYFENFSPLHVNTEDIEVLERLDEKSRNFFPTQDYNYTIAHSYEDYL